MSHPSAGFFYALMASGYSTLGIILPMTASDRPKFDFIDDAMAQVLRSKTHAERLAIGHRMWSHARKMLVAVLRNQHPDWSAQQIQHEAAHRLSHGAV
jgi:hypothetical protein